MAKKNKKEKVVDIPRRGEDEESTLLHYMGPGEGMVDVHDVKYLQVIVSKERWSKDTYTVWINTERGCILRAQRVEQFEIKDERDV